MKNLAMKSNKAPDPDHATAALAIDGIALYCFTQDGKLQIAFIREPHHVLSLKIIEISAAGEETIVAHTLNLSPDEQIFLDASAPTQATSTWFETDGFDRRDLLKDFRLLPDLEGELHERALQLRNPPQHRVTLLTVNNAHFYVRSVFGPVKKIQNPSGDRVNFGLIADTIGADIGLEDGEASRVILKNADDQNVVELPKKPGVRYLIVFKNICDVSVTSTVTDFALCYTVVRDPNDITFDFEPLTIISGNDACNGGRMAETTDLSPLLA